MTAPPPDRLLRRREVEAVTGLSCSRLYALMGAGHFPRPLRIGSGPRGAVAWPTREIEQWIAERPRSDGWAVPNGAGR